MEKFSTNAFLAGIFVTLFIIAVILLLIEFFTLPSLVDKGIQTALSVYDIQIK